jgi:glycosyltransferase involved in cell wall biosynthesis
MKNNLYIIHENGAPRHFEALYYLNDKEEHFDNIVSVEFTFVRQFVKGVVRRDFSVVKRSLRNLFLLLYLLFTKNKRIIIGAAPYDMFIFLLYLLRSRHNTVYYSSWPYWDFSKYPKKLRMNLQRRLWEKFLTNIQVVGVTKPVVQGLSRYTERATVIPHCINEDIFFSQPKKSDDKFVIVYVGRLIPEKGISLMIDLIADLQGEDNIEWRFVGDGPLRDEVQNLASLNDNVKYYGQIKNPKELAAIYNESNLLLLPSFKNHNWEELFGIVLIEAMACGAVPVTTESIGPKTIISHQQDGFLLNEEGIFEEIKSIILKLKKDKPLFEQMSRNAIDNATAHYTVKRTSSLWRSVLMKERELLPSFATSMNGLASSSENDLIS